MSKNIWGKLAQFQKQVQIIGFDSVNPHFKNKYASLAAVVKACAPVLSENGLAFSQIFSGSDIITIVADTETGEKIESVLRLPVAETATAQQIGSAITYMKRYALCAILGVVGDDDDDGNEATKTPPAKAVQPEPKKPLTDAQKLAIIPETVNGLKTLAELNAFYARCQPILDNKANGLTAIDYDRFAKIFEDKAAKFAAKFSGQLNKFVTEDEI